MRLRKPRTAAPDAEEGRNSADRHPSRGAPNRKPEPAVGLRYPRPMLRAGVGVSSAPEPRIAAEEAVEQAMAPIGRADAALLFATTAHKSGMGALLDTAMAGPSTGM